MTGRQTTEQKMTAKCRCPKTAKNINKYAKTHRIHHHMDDGVAEFAKQMSATTL